MSLYHFESKCLIEVVNKPKVPDYFYFLSKAQNHILTDLNDRIDVK